MVFDIVPIYDVKFNLQLRATYHYSVKNYRTRLRERIKGHFPQFIVIKV